MAAASGRQNLGTPRFPNPKTPPTNPRQPPNLAAATVRRLSTAAAAPYTRRVDPSRPARYPSRWNAAMPCSPSCELRRPDAPIGPPRPALRATEESSIGRRQSEPFRSPRRVKHNAGALATADLAAPRFLNRSGGRRPPRPNPRHPTSLRPRRFELGRRSSDDQARSLLHPAPR